MLKRIKHFLTARLHRECMNNDIKAVKKRLAKGVDVNVKCPYGEYPLHYAVTKEMVQLLVEGGADVNSQRNGDKWTALHLASHMGSNETVEFLIANGADVNAMRSGGGTPLSYAASWGHEEIVELLIAKGADVNAKDDDGRTPLDIVLAQKQTTPLPGRKTPSRRVRRNDHPQIADLLRKHGAKTSEELKAEAK